MKVLIALACVAVASAFPPSVLQTPDIRQAIAPQEAPATPEVDAVKIEDAPLNEADDRTVESALGPQTPNIRPVFVPEKVPFKVTVDSPPTPEVDTVRVVDAPLDEVVDPVNDRTIEIALGPQTPDIRPVFAPQEVPYKVTVEDSPPASKVDTVRVVDAPLDEVVDPVNDRSIEIALGPQTPDIRPVFAPQEVPYKITVEDSPPASEVDTVRVVDAPLNEVFDPVNVVDALVYEPISRSELETLVFMLQDDPEKVVVIDHYPQIPLLPPRGVPPYLLPPYYQNPLWR